MLRNIYSLKRVLARWRSDASGNIAIVFALSAIVLMLVVGAAVDMGRWVHARDQTQSATDAAVLAGGRWLQTNSSDSAGAIAAAQNFYNQNVTSRLPVVNDTISFAVGSDGLSVQATGNAYIRTPFLQFGGIDQLPLIPLSQQTVSEARFKVGNGDAQTIEVAVMVDITGSMAGQKLSDLQAAATDLVKIILPDPSQNMAKVSLVPFTEDIRLPTTTALNAARGTSLPSTRSVTTGFLLFQVTTTYYLSDCVVERTGTQKYTDAAPGSGQYVMGHYTTSSTGSGSNKKGVCVVPSPVVPLTSNQTTVVDAIKNLKAGGGTAGHLGTAWAWYTLSPNWAALWPPESQPAAYDTPTVKKYAVLMTDGQYNTQYDTNGISVNQNATTCPQAANGCSTPQALSQCAAMKANNITVYTVGFQVGSDQTAVNTLTACASDPTMFCKAEDGDQLKQCYRDIAIKMTHLWISQ